MTKFKHEFKVWAPYKLFIEDPEAYHVMASFYFLNEALDYADYCIGRGVPCVVTGMYGYTSVKEPLDERQVSND